MRNNRWIPISKLILVIGFTALVGFILEIHAADIRKTAGARDTVAYWSAARLLVEGHNPYDNVSVLDLERRWAGYLDDRPLVLRTPPWSLFMIVPLGFLTPFTAWLLWMACSLACLVAGMKVCGAVFASEEATPNNLLSLVGYTFAPVAACLTFGQMGLPLMLGLVLFLYWEKRRPFLAGSALVLPFAKPHLLLLFWLALLCWVTLRRQGRLLFGFGATLGTAIAIAIALDRHILGHYLAMVHSASIKKEFIPALSGVIRLLFFHDLFWVQWVPLAMGLIWWAWFFVPQLSTWNWSVQGPALLVISMLVAPYSWLADESVLLPAILQATVFLYQVRSQLKTHNKVTILGLALLNVLLLLLLKAKVPLASGIYFWSSLVWTFWYFHAYGLHRRYAQIPVLEADDMKLAS
ncbi:MAG: DUF2029 domain-containing protein [Acidobacteria bacterium]|nr:DUF2029 domain-containing protein [Acidobacteriota bacterium]